MTLLQAAWRLRADGYVIVPVGADKRPLAPWRQRYDAPPTLADIEREFAIEFPDAAGIGLLTGPQCDVIDIEAHGLELAHELGLPHGPRSRTGRGGLHIFVEHDPSIRQGPIKVGGVGLGDYKGFGGYVVVPPSVGPTGGRYEWIAELGTVPLGVAPAWVVEARTRRPSEARRARRRAPQPLVPPPVFSRSEAIELVVEQQAFELLHEERDSWSERAFRAAMHLLAAGVPNEEVEHWLLDYAVAREALGPEVWGRGEPQPWVARTVAAAEARLPDIIPHAQIESVGRLVVCRVLEGVHEDRWTRPPLDEPGTPRHEAWCRACGERAPGVADVRSKQVVRVQVLEDGRALRGIRVFPAE